MSKPSAPGFNIQQQPVAPGYSYPAYPPQGAPHQPQPHLAYQPQPFPPPIQIQPGTGPVVGYNSGWYANSTFRDYLRNASSFHIKQKVELLEILSGWETPNRYTIKDQSGNHVFYAGEESGLCTRQCFGKNRPFTLTIKDTQGHNVMIMDRPLDCGCCFGSCCGDSLTVSTPSGQLLGSVSETCNILYPTLDIKDQGGNTVLKLEGPMCPFAFGSCTGSVVFRVLNLQGVSVGTISKEWSGLLRELFTDADYFSISFPPDLDPSIKAVLIGALFLIDFQYFEKGPCEDGQGGRRLFG